MSAAGEPFSRRREVSATSARSLLLTVLGEFVLPAGAPVWTQSLLDALALVGVEEKSARQALARIAADDVVGSTREGRRVRWALTTPGHRLLSEGAARIYAHGARRPAWDGRWLVLVVTVPEAQRALRHRLRTRLAWAGLGSPAPGVWVCPDPHRARDAQRVLDEAGLGDAAISVVGDTVGGMTAERLVDQAWDLRDLEEGYEEFLAGVGAEDPRSDTEALAAQIRLVDAWRRFPLLDPGLPPELLPARWAGARATALFRARHTVWRPGAERAWAALDQSSAGQSS